MRTMSEVRDGEILGDIVEILWRLLCYIGHLVMRTSMLYYEPHECISVREMYHYFVH
jgi:hypothetical protein